MGNCILAAVSKKGFDNLEPSEFESMLDIPVKTINDKEAKLVKDQVEQPKQVYLVVNAASG